MNCKDFEPIIGELGDEALAHAAGCARCAGRLEEQRRVAASLRALAEEDRGREAPARQEALLLEDFRRRRASPVPKHATRSWHVALGCAAATLVVVAVGARVLHRKVPALPQAVVTPLPDLSVVKRPEQAVVRHAPPVRRQAAAKSKRAAVEHEVATEFLPLAFGDSLTPLESGQVVRIRLSRSALGSFGLPINEERAGERVQADVLLGQDGMARAIRLVR